MRRTILVILVGMIVSGCHTFQPTSIAELTPGQDIRVRVSGAFSDSLSSIVPGDSRSMEGAFVESTETSVFMDVPVTSEYEGMRLQTLSQRIEIPAGELLDIEWKQLSGSRTGIAVGTVVALASAIVIGQLSGDKGGGSPPGVPGPVDYMTATPSLSIGDVIAWIRGLW
jgi:hypothetical protein